MNSAVCSVNYVRMVNKTSTTDGAFWVSRLSKWRAPLCVHGITPITQYANFGSAYSTVC